MYYMPINTELPMPKTNLDNERQYKRAQIVIFEVLGCRLDSRLETNLIKSFSSTEYIFRVSQIAINRRRFAQNICFL